MFTLTTDGLCATYSAAFHAVVVGSADGSLRAWPGQKLVRYIFRTCMLSSCLAFSSILFLSSHRLYVYRLCYLRVLPARLASYVLYARSAVFADWFLHPRPRTYAPWPSPYGCDIWFKSRVAYPPFCMYLIIVWTQ